MTQTPPIDHVGWQLFQAFSAWKIRFNQRMVEKGCVWMADARGSLMQHIGPNGIGQNELVQRSGLTKQAVQQHLDSLVQDGVVERVSNEQDARKKHVQLTSKGVEASQIANSVKLELEAEIRRAIGPSHFGVLRSMLDDIAKISD